MNITGIAEHTHLYVNVEFDPGERFEYSPTRHTTYVVHEVQVEFSGSGLYDALQVQRFRPHVKVTKGFRVKADGSQGAPIGRNHSLYPFDIDAAKFDKIVETAREEAFRQLKLEGDNL